MMPTLPLPRKASPAAAARSQATTDQDDLFTGLSGKARACAIRGSRRRLKIPSTTICRVAESIRQPLVEAPRQRNFCTVR